MENKQLIAITSMLVRGNRIINNEPKFYRKKLNIITEPSMFEYYRTKYSNIYSTRLTNIKITFTFIELPL